MKFHLRYVRAVLFAVAVLGFAQVTHAQEITGVISGTVKDPNGAAVAGASVTLSDADKQVVVRTVTTNENGEDNAPNLLVGFYDISVHSPNFKKALLSRVKLDVGQRRSADVTLEPGNITESVLVESAPVAVELTTPTASTVINGDQVRQLSINNRNFVQLVTLAPGVSNDLDDLVFTGTNNPDTQTVNRTLISVNGARSTQNTFTVDGADVTDRGSNLTIQAYPSIDSIGEFKVLRSMYPAESGRSGGGQVNIVTRAGGDSFHGSDLEFIRNEAFNANDFQTNRTPALATSFGRDDNGKIRRKPFRYNNYGFTVGGPVYVPKFGEGLGGMGKKLERTFFFFSEEQRRDTRYPTLSTRNVTGGGAAPTALMKQGIFPIPICLSAANTTATGCTSVLPAGTPLSSLSPVSNVAQQYITQIWNKVPNPTDAATLQLDFPDINVAKFRQEIIRVDHTLNNRWNFFYRFEHDKIPTEDADGTIGGRSNLPFVNRTVSDSPGKTHTFQAIYTPNPNMIFEGRFTYGYGAIYIDTVGLLAKSVSPIAVNLPYESVRDTVAIVSVAGFNSLTGFSNYIDPSSKGNIAGALTWIRGAHSTKYGFMFSRNMT